jgi:hypothetical protein
MDQILQNGPNGIKCSQMKFHPTLILQYLAEFIYHNKIILWKLTLDTLHSYLCTYLGTYLPTYLIRWCLPYESYWEVIDFGSLHINLLAWLCLCVQ